jgi:hypothetical protein
LGNDLFAPIGAGILSLERELVKTFAIYYAADEFNILRAFVIAAYFYSQYLGLPIGSIPCSLRIWSWGVVSDMGRDFLNYF